MRLMIWGIAGSSSLVLALLTGRGEIGPAGWSVLTLLLVGACCQSPQPRLAMLLFGIGSVVSIGAIAHEELEIGAATSAVAFLLVALTALAWHREWRQMRRDIVHQAIDQQLVAVDLPRAREPSRSREMMINSARQLADTHPPNPPEPIDIHRKRA